MQELRAEVMEGCCLLTDSQVCAQLAFSNSADPPTRCSDALLDMGTVKPGPNNSSMEAVFSYEWNCVFFHSA